MHGTDLELVRLFDEKERDLFGIGYNIDFIVYRSRWKHFNFEARSCSADPNDKPFLLFAETYRKGGEQKYITNTLSLVNPTDKANGCLGCWSYINHPRHGFRAGFDTSVASEPMVLSEQAAAELSEFALQDYNEKNGTNLKFERALGCNCFTCEGLLMDFRRKNRRWVHMNFEARVGPNDEVLRLFGELYLGDDGKYVVATLSVAEPSTEPNHGEWIKDFVERGCRFCPDAIIHPWRGYGYGFNAPPIRMPPDIYCKTHGLDIDY